MRLQLIATGLLLVLILVTTCAILIGCAAPKSREEIDQARITLQTFFTLLHNGRYVEATRLFGGDYQTLRDANPDVSAYDYALLLERACRQNGFQCLELKSIVEQTLQSATETRFTVEFTTTDGRLFVRGPCCGATETEMPSVSRFEYTVKKIGDSFLVQELPVYVP